MMLLSYLTALWYFAGVFGYPVELITASEESHLIEDPPVTHKVTLQITSHTTNVEDNKIESLILGDLTIGLFGTTVPKTVNNFVNLANMTYGYGYMNVPFHRIISDFMVQTGAFTEEGGKSIYGDKFDDENFDLAHNKLGRLSMANAGPNTNGGQFFITTKESCGWLDGHHVVFGQLVNGFDVLEKLDSVATDTSDKPIDQITISNIQVYTLFNTADVLNEVENPDPVTIELVEPTGNFTYLFFFIFAGLVVLVVKKVYFKRQHIIDLKDRDYF